MIAIAAFAVYQLAESKSLTPDSAIAATNLPDNDTAQMTPKPAPDFSLKDLDGKTYNLSDYRGKVVMLNFWATWCPPCVKEIPEYVELQAEYGSQGVQFLGIALDDEGAAKIKPWLAKHPVSYPIMVPDPKVIANYGDLSSIPVTYIIDRKGMIRESFVGIRKKEVVVEMLKKYLSEGGSGTASNPAGK